jgi:hypothetical protein
MALLERCSESCDFLSATPRARSVESCYSVADDACLVCMQNWRLYETASLTQSLPRCGEIIYIQYFCINGRCYIVFDAKNIANLFPIGQLIVLIVDNPQIAAPPRVDAHYCFGA